MTTRSLIIVLFFAASLANLNGLALYPFLPSIATDFDTSVSVIGQAATITLVTGAIIGLIAGPLADHYGRRRLVIFGALMMSVCSAATALAGSLEMLLAARFPGGIATGIMLGIGMSLATTQLDGDARRSAIGWIASGAAFGAVIGPPVLTTLAQMGTWRTGFWFLAFAPLLLALSCLRVIAPDQARPNTPIRLFSIFSEYSEFVLHRRSALLQCATLCWAVPTVGGSAYLGAYLIQTHGFSLTAVGLGYMWAATWLMMGPRLAIRLLRYVELYPLIVFGGGILMVTTTTLFWVPIGLPWILIFMALWPLSMGLGLTLMTSAVSEAARVGQGTAMMARQFSWTAGGAVGVALGGLMIAVGGYALFGVIVGTFALGVAGIVLLADRPEPAQTSEPAELPTGG